MKFWKAVGLAALAASLVPYRVEKSEFDQSVTVESLLLRVKAGKGPEDGGTAIDVELLPLFNNGGEEPSPEHDGSDPFAGDDEPVIPAAAGTPQAPAAEDAQPEGDGPEGVSL